MSDMYLVLRTRLDEVTNWVVVGTDVMKNARTALGLGYETAAHKLSVSSKTYERREKAGRWPAHEMDRLADVFNLELERPARVRVTAREESATEVLDAILEGMAELRQEVALLRRAVEGRLPPLADLEVEAEPV